jgi:hypothetical protein
MPLPPPEFAEGVLWDGTTPHSRPNTDVYKGADAEIGNRHSSEILALEELLTNVVSTIGVLENLGDANTVLGVNNDGTELEYKTVLDIYTLYVNKLHIGDELAGYEDYPFVVNTGGGGVIFHRIHPTEEPYVQLTNSTTGSGGQIRGLTAGGLTFADAADTFGTYGVNINLNGVDCNLGDDTNHLLLRGGSGSAYDTGRQIRLSYDGSTRFAHGIRTRHDSSTKDQNSLDVYIWEYGVDDEYVNMGTFLAMRLTPEWTAFLHDDYELIFGSSSSASIYYNGSNFIIDPKKAGAGILDILGILQTDGYNAADGTGGATADVEVADAGGGTETLHFKNGLYTSSTSNIAEDLVFGYTDGKLVTVTSASGVKTLAYVDDVLDTITDTRTQTVRTLIYTDEVLTSSTVGPL